MSNKNIEIRSSEEAIDNKVIQMATTFDRSSLNVTGGCINLPQWSNGANNHNNKAITQVEPLETLVAKSYNEVSHEERGKLLNELHGVSDEIPETRELIQEHLAELDMELGKIDDKKAYELALSLSPQYVQDRRFLLMFLRADSFDVRASAMRMVRHFEEKLNLFGSDLLTKDILLSDLEDHEIQYFRCGRQQPLMQRDRSGRMISFVTRQQQTEQISIVTRVSTKDEDGLCVYLSVARTNTICVDESHVVLYDGFDYRRRANAEARTCSRMVGSHKRQAHVQRTVAYQQDSFIEQVTSYPQLSVSPMFERQCRSTCDQLRSAFVGKPIENTLSPSFW